MKFEIEPVYLFGMLWFDIVLGLLVISSVSIMLILIRNKKLSKADKQMFIILWCMFTILATGILFGAGASTVSSTVQASKIAGIESLGFTDVDLDNTDAFTANLQGKYFTGMLSSIGENKYQILAPMER